MMRNLDNVQPTLHRLRPWSGQMATDGVRGKHGLPGAVLILMPPAVPLGHTLRFLSWSIVTAALLPFLLSG